MTKLLENISKHWEWVLTLVFSIAAAGVLIAQVKSNADNTDSNEIRIDKVEDEVIEHITKYETEFRYMRKDFKELKELIKDNTK